MDADTRRITVGWVDAALAQLNEAHKGGNPLSIQAARQALAEVLESVREVMAHPEAA